MTKIIRGGLVFVLGLMLACAYSLRAGDRDFPDVLTIRERVETVNHITRLRLD